MNEALLWGVDAAKRARCDVPLQLHQLVPVHPAHAQPKLALPGQTISQNLLVRVSTGDVEDAGLAVAGGHTRVGQRLCQPRELA